MLKKTEKDGTAWMQTLWRPMMGWMYMIICMLDMAVFPVLWSLLQATMHMPITQWNPLTLQGAGLFHIAMGAVLGISAFGRTQEKLAGTAANPTTTQTITQNTNMPGMAGGFGNGSTAPATGFASGAPAFGAPATTGFGASSTSFTPAPSWGTTPTGFGGNTGFGTTPPATPVSTGFGGKKVVPDFPQPAI
jgi:hypothetical protein